MAPRVQSRVKPVQSGASAGPRLRNVILVDDDSLERTALGRLLRGAGYNVTAFERPSDVLLSLLPRSNTCLVLDIYMPEMTGVALWQELRNRGFEVPTVLITGHRDQQTRLYGEQIGAAAVLYKPVEEKELFEAIDRALMR
jgi:FixJ family two-component response regulator